ncbi:hypothetical protein SBOR_5313 [Sclerotinia borealis F-4128]|uniref:EKC/KEOPS complex subunit BUD32 n=1 Tax=Sclerotinia borealis (strain F-4128) TaxID=1432307 RepID=W9CC53_SCLBF|nr:hypothetical protein SBOR_5313 [Sclerotinia borealis F-4128]
MPIRMTDARSENTFDEDIQRLRAAYEQKRNSTNLVPPIGRPNWDISIDVVDGTVIYTYWFELDDNKLQCIRLADIPDTLSGDILRLNRNLPTSIWNSRNNYEIIGDKVTELNNAPSPPDFEPDDEDITSEISMLPDVVVDPVKHFVKKGKYRSEIRNLLACQGGSCPGSPISPHIIRLLGKSADGKLVFEKFNPRYILALVHPLAQYKSWILQVISGLLALHSVGIVHRDLRIDNLIFTLNGGHRLYIIDLESRWGNRLAPEISKEPILNAGWSEKSDIYDLGYVIKGMIYGNTPITYLVEWDVPEPLKMVVDACTRMAPADRPSLMELYNMVLEISD